MAASNNSPSNLMDESQSNEVEPPKAKVSKIGGGRKRSMVWDHFTVIKTENPSKPRAACNWCGVDYACESKQNGTKSMLTHLQLQCKKYPFRNVDTTQTTLIFKSKKYEKGENKDKEVVDVAFDAEACRKALAEMLIIDELPLGFVEGEGFRRFMLVACPEWARIPSCIMVAKDCFKVFESEKKKLKRALRGQRICLAIDTWTSVQSLKYMCLTAHFIDNDWKLHKKILNFCLVESHKGETLGKKIEECLLEWGIDKILTLTVDNASSNSGMIQFIKRVTKNRKGIILKHEFLHMRCCAHIFNLIVREGLKDMDESIVKVRNAVRYVRSSPERWETFKLCAELEAITCKSQVCLDVPTKWNFTYLMLDRAEKFQKAFERLEEDDIQFLKSLREEEGEDRDEEDTNGKGKIVTRRSLGPPDIDDWDKVRLFVKFLKLFYDAILRFSGANHVTCNTFFIELMLIKDTINDEFRDGPLFLKSMVEDMNLKFEKYWGNFDNINMLLFFALILDPRYKLRYVSFYFGKLYDGDKAKVLTTKVKNAFTRLYNSYVENETSCGQEQKVSQSSDGTSSSGFKDVRALRMSQFRKHLEDEISMESKSEVEKYLAENCEQDVEGFDILAWWKINSARYHMLSNVAQHVLAIPVSTVASESAFSTACRVLDPFRSSLAPTMVEALICGQSWLRSSSTPISLREAMYDVEEYEKLELELMEEASASNPTRTLFVDDMEIA